MRSTENILIGLFATAIIVGFLGIVNAEGPYIDNDADCETPSQPHDEPTEGCYEYCYEQATWYGSLSREACYWDDEPPEAEA